MLEVSRIVGADPELLAPAEGTFIKSTPIGLALLSWSPDSKEAEKS